MRECGGNNFTIEIIEYCENQEQLNEREKFWIRVLNSTVPNGYNLSPGGGNSGRIAKPKIAVTNVSNKIVFLRENRGLTQTELADILKINRSVLNRIEKDTRPIRDEELKSIADYFRVSVDYLLDNENQKKFLYPIRKK